MPRSDQEYRCAYTEQKDRAWIGYSDRGRIFSRTGSKESDSYKPGSLKFAFLIVLAPDTRPTSNYERLNKDRIRKMRSHLQPITVCEKSFISGNDIAFSVV